MKRILAVAAIVASALTLAACSSVLKDDTVTLHMAVGGANINPSTGLSLGYGSTQGHFVPTRTSDGKGLLLAPCGSQPPAAYATLNGTASASAQGTATAPQASVAIANVSATGEAARYLTLGAPGAAPTPQAIDAANSCDHLQTGP